MNTEALYDDIILSTYFNKLRALLDSWSTEVTVTPLDDIGMPFLSDIFGQNCDAFSYLVDSSSIIAKEMIDDVIVRLMDLYKVPASYYHVELSKPIAIKAEGINTPLILSPLDKAETMLVIATPSTDGDTLYFFKKYGLNHLIDGADAKLCKAYKCARFKYVSYVELNAFSEKLNHNNDECDESRGTNIYSLKYFFDLFFDQDEYQKFAEYYSRFINQVRSYYGLSIVSTLSPHALYSYKFTLEEHLKSYKYESEILSFSSANNVSHDQIDYLLNQYLSDKRYSVLLGLEDFAQSFVTADWLFNTFQRNAGNIDLSTISMGYYKSIEQFLFKLVSLHTQEKERCRRTILINRKSELLTDDLLKKRRKDITLGTLTGFFRYYKNEDLYDDKLDSNTIEFIKKILFQVADLRNGYFHKDNISDWEKVESDRRMAYLIYFILLGAITISKEEQLKLNSPVLKDDYFKLCEYLYNKRQRDLLTIPVYFVPDLGKHRPLIREYDPKISFDQQGNPSFSGIYFKESGADGKHYSFTKNNLPSRIIESSLLIGRAKLSFTISNDKHLIFQNGKFLL